MGTESHKRVGGMDWPAKALSTSCKSPFKVILKELEQQQLLGFPKWDVMMKKQPNKIKYKRQMIKQYIASS
jgi:hypothetical protein